MSTQALKQAATGQTQTRAMSFPHMLQAYESQIAAALPSQVDPARFSRIALSCFRNSPKLTECTPSSIFACVIQSAQLGLEPGINGQAYLVPFWNRDIGGLECQFIPGYRGLIKLARNTGEIESVSAQIVYEHDSGELVMGTDEKLVHLPLMDGNRGAPSWVYCVAHLNGDGGNIIEWMSWDEIQGIKARSKSRNRQGELVGPWVSDENEMSRKTVVRRASKYWPMSIELATAVALDTAAAMGIAQRLNAEEILDGVGYQVPDDDDAPQAKPNAKSDKTGWEPKPPRSNKAPEAKPPIEGETVPDKPDEAEAKPDTPTESPYTAEQLLELIDESKTDADLEYVGKQNAEHMKGDDKSKVGRAINAKRTELKKAAK